MAERFEYYLYQEKVFAYDTESTFLVYFREGDWHEECNVPHDTLLDEGVSRRLSEEEAMAIVGGVNPLEATEAIILQDMYKNIFCP